MPLTNSQVQEAYRHFLNGQKVGKMADGRGLSFQKGHLWRFLYRFGGLQKDLALGEYPDVSIKDARIKTGEARKLLAQGIDPNVQRKEAKAGRKKAEQEAALTFEVVAREWIEKQDWSDKTKKKNTQRIEKHLFPYIGNIPINKLKFEDLRSALMHMYNIKDLAYRIAGYAKNICKYAKIMQYIDNNMATDLSETLPKRNEVDHRDAITDKEEFGKLLIAIDKYKGKILIKYLLKISPYVFVRPSELRLAEWSEIDFSNRLWTIPKGRMKMNRVFKVPLSEQVMKLLNELYELTGHGQFLFPSPNHGAKCISDTRARNALKRMGYKGKMSLHGFRGTASTLLNECGKFRYDVIEAQLSHEGKDVVRAAYNHAEYMKERTDMMQAWADMLDEMRDAVK